MPRTKWRLRSKSHFDNIAIHPYKNSVTRGVSFKYGIVNAEQILMGKCQTEESALCYLKRKNKGKRRSQQWRDVRLRPDGSFRKRRRTKW